MPSLARASVSLAAEYGPKVRVNTLSAGPFMTEQHSDWSEAEIAAIPNAAQRPGTPEEVVPAMLLLASNAASYVSGALLRVDGGLR